MMADVEMIAVESSNALSAGYDKTKKELFVKFRGNAVYKYSKVPAIIFKGLLEAESFGKFLGNRIKNKYQFTKLES